MPDVEAPEVELDDDAPQFRRRLALVVVLVTLFAAAVAYLHEQNGNFEDNASRDAQLASIRAFGQQVDALKSYDFDYNVFVQKELVQRRIVVANSRERASLNDAESQLYTSQADRYTKVGDAIGGETNIQDQNGSVARDSELQTEPDREQLRQIAFAAKSNDYGNKADAYVAVLTVLAVGLFLIGLSLTVSGRGRYLLAIPGVAIAIVCLVWAVGITLGGITRVSDNAIQLTVEGQRLVAGAPADDQDARRAATQSAIVKYQAAVADSPDFGVAWARLADAEFESGVVPTPGSSFASVSDHDATERAVQAGEKAISLGASDPSVLSSIGFYHFLVGDYGRAADLSQEALDGNDQFPPLVFNLGVVQVAQGDADGARATYQKGIDRLHDPSFDGLRFDIIAAALTDLEVAANDAPDRGDLVQEMKGMLVAEEAKSALPGDPTVPDQAPSDASISDAQIGIDSLGFRVTYNTDGFDAGTQLLNIWYYRSVDRNSEGPFVQAPNLGAFSATGTNPVSTTPRENGDCFPGGDYRVEVYAGRDMVGSAEKHLDDSSLGSLVTKGGESNGFTLCTPKKWEVDKEVSNDRDTLAFSNPDDPSQAFVVASFPAPGAADTEPQQVLDANLSALAQELQVQIGPSTPGADLVGRTENGDNISLTTASVEGTGPNGEQVRMIGSIGSDNVTRLVVVTAGSAADLDPIAGELVPLIRFLGVPDTTTPSGG